MDPNYVDEEEEAAAIAAMMGFSGFGSHKTPAKKRKFTTDAFVEGQEPTPAVNKGGKKGQGSGGNTMPLGKTRMLGTAPASKPLEPMASNDEEIDLGDEEEADGPQYIDTSLPPPIMSKDEENPYRPHFEPPPGVSEGEAKETQSRIDAILASVGSSAPAPPALPTPANVQIPHSLPQRPNSQPPDTVSNSMSVASSRPSHRGGPRNENWYLDYYDPSFNENPWAKLEREKGLEQLGDWPDVQGPRKFN